jgi:hypothetical protein
MDAGLPRIANGPAQSGVVPARQHGVVITLDALRVVAKIAAHTAISVGKLGEIEAVARSLVDDRHRRMASDTKIPELAARLALTSPVHGDENGIFRGIGVHAAGPLAIVTRMAPRAHLGIE